MASSQDQQNFECVTIASVDFIKLPLKDILESRIQPVDLFKEINSCPALLSHKYKLRQDQLKLCFLQPPAEPDYRKFDVTLLYTLIRNLCPSLKPTKGWGTQPDDADIQIGDDIERLRLFRNNYYGHASSSTISDADLAKIWKDLKSVISRIQSTTKCSVDYEDELIKIERAKFTRNQLENCKVLLEALVILQQQKEDGEEPHIVIKGDDEIVCGCTANFKAEVKKIDLSRWLIKWQKLNGLITEIINTSKEKYTGSTDTQLVIQSVCREDEGKYQAVILQESKGIENRLSSNVICLHVVEEEPHIVIKGDDVIVCGCTANFKAEVKKIDLSRWLIKWQKLNGLITEIINTSKEKYTGSTDTQLVIQSVCREDEGKYQAVILQESKGIENRLSSNVICLHVVEDEQEDPLQISHHNFMATDGYRKHVEDVGKSETKGEKLMSQTQDLNTKLSGTQKIADDEGTDADVTHDVFLIHCNEPKEDKEFALVKLKPLLEGQNLKVLVDEEDFQGGESVFFNIARAIIRCRKSLIVMTEYFWDSSWCSLELLLALEKSHRRNIMSVVILRKGNSIKHQLSLDMLNEVPHVDIQNDEDIEGKLNELVSKIKESKHIEELLPAGNVAHGLVWSHYFGLLQYLLPYIAALVEKTEIYKKYPTRFSKKLYELIPENCHCPRVMKDIPKDNSERRISVMTEKLPNLSYGRSGHKQNVQMTIYCVRDTEGTKYYCIAEYPAVIAGMQKMIEETSCKLRECDRRTQVGRFYYTLSALVRHEFMETTLNKANVIMYNENRPGFVLADVLVMAIKEDLHVEAIENIMIERPLDRLSQQEPKHFEHDAFLLYDDESHELGVEILNYLERKDIKLYTGIENERKWRGESFFDLNYVIKRCFWTIVILTRKALKNRTFQLQLLSLLESFLEDKKIRLIPVLVDTRYGDIPPAIRLLTYVGVDENKRYLEKLYCILKEKETPFDRDTFIPAGNIAYGLAWTYVLNNLSFVLHGLDDSIHRALMKHNKRSSIYKEKVYIIVPFSCNCKAKLSDADASISYLDTIHPLYVTHGGNTRKYSFDMYTFWNKDKEYVFVGQYAEPITCLDNMWTVKIAGLSEEDKIKQARIFLHEIQNVLDQKLKEDDHFCEIVPYDDRKYFLSEEMTKRLKHKQ